MRSGHELQGVEKAHYARVTHPTHHAPLAPPEAAAAAVTATAIATAAAAAAATLRVDHESFPDYSIGAATDAVERDS